MSAPAPNGGHPAPRVEPVVTAAGAGLVCALTFDDGPNGADTLRLLDALLLPHTGTNLSDLAWVRQSPGKPGRKTFAAIIERLTLLRAIGIDPDIAVGVHPERLRRLCQEGVRLTAQHVRTL